MARELYVDMENLTEAEKYLKEGNSIYEKAGDTMGQLSETLPALSRLYLNRGETEKAKALIEKTYAYASKNRRTGNSRYSTSRTDSEGTNQ
jgi:tetratricopeptide (TPR) repeat protein